jgi:hypothetical protein
MTYIVSWNKVMLSQVVAAELDGVKYARVEIDGDSETVRFIEPSFIEAMRELLVEGI